jgi:hypothetical protein
MQIPRPLILLALLPLAAAAAAESAPQYRTNGGRILASYFRLETARLAGRSLTRRLG